MASPRKLNKALKQAGFVVLHSSDHGTVWTDGYSRVLVPNKSDVRARTENAVREAEPKVAADLEDLGGLVSEKGAKVLVASK